MLWGRVGHHPGVAYLGAGHAKARPHPCDGNRRSLGSRKRGIPLEGSKEDLAISSAGVFGSISASVLGRERELDVEEMLKAGESQKWEVYIQTPRGQPEDLLDYLGRYVYRTAMSNHRILAGGGR